MQNLNVPERQMTVSIVENMEKPDSSHWNLLRVYKYPTCIVPKSANILTKIVAINRITHLRK